MPEPIADLQKAIRDLHGCGSTFVEAVPVDERFQGKPVWQGTVYVFDLTDHGEALRAYAWSAGRAGGKRRYTAVLHSGRVDSPQAAVRAAIVAERRKPGNGT